MNSQEQSPPNVSNSSAQNASNAEAAHPGAREPQERGRRRSEKSRMAILEAAQELASTTKSYRAFSYDAIAKRAGVGKATIYRWWPSKLALLVELNSEAFPEPDLEEISQGSLLDDLKEMIRFEYKAQTQGVTRAIYSGATAKLVAEDETSGRPSGALVHEYCEQKTGELDAIFDRAVYRGDWVGPYDIELAFETYYSNIFYRVIVRGLPLDEPLIERYAQLTLLAAKPLR